MTKQNELLISLGWELATTVKGLEAAEEKASQGVLDQVRDVQHHRISLAEKFDEVLVSSILASGIKGEADKIRAIVEQIHDLLDDEILQTGDLAAKVVYLRDVRGLALGEIAEMLGYQYGYIKKYLAETLQRGNFLGTDSTEVT